MSTAMRWVVAAVAVVLVLCLLGWARGQAHHRGDEVGSSLGSAATTIAGR
jgi:lipopolysaccharide export system protein LptC